MGPLFYIMWFDLFAKDFPFLISVSLFEFESGGVFLDDLWLDYSLLWFLLLSFSSNLKLKFDIALYYIVQCGRKVQGHRCW